MTLEETLKYMEAQIPLKEGQLDKQFRTLKANLQKQNPNLNDEKLDGLAAAQLERSGQFPGMNTNDILNKVRQNIANGNKIANSKNLQANTAGTNAQQAGQVTPTQNGDTQQAVAPVDKNLELQNVQQELAKLKEIPASPEVSDFSKLSDEDLEKQITDQSKKAKEYLDRISYLTDLANRLLNDPKLTEASNINKKLGQGFGGFLKGLLNTAAGILGNFIGGIANGMGAAK